VFSSLKIPIDKKLLAQMKNAPGTRGTGLQVRLRTGLYPSRSALANRCPRQILAGRDGQEHRVQARIRNHDGRNVPSKSGSVNQKSRGLAIKNASKRSITGGDLARLLDYKGSIWQIHYLRGIIALLCPLSEKVVF
jgi:hypothetical protein